MADFADEILILDSFSSDRTKEIVEKFQFPIRFFESVFSGYGSSKNKLEGLAKCDFVFSIDADEVVSPGLKTSILNEKSRGFTSNLFEVKRENIYCGKSIRFGGWNPDIKIRLWKKGIAHWDLAEVHEDLVVKVGAKSKLLEGPLLHFSYQTIEEHYFKVEKYAERGAVQLFRTGKSGSYFKLIFSPLVRFIRDYFLKLGFLDGQLGFTIARITAYEVFLKYQKLLKINQNKQ